MDRAVAAAAVVAVELEDNFAVVVAAVEALPDIDIEAASEIAAVVENRRRLTNSSCRG